MSRPTTIGAAATLAALLALAPAAAAHVTLNPDEGPADGYATVGVQVPHGCADAATRLVRVQIPESVPSVTPQVHPGWAVRTKEGPKEPVELHGETVKRGVAEVIWELADGGEPLPSDRLDVFGMSVKLPAWKPGTPVYFPTVQECVDGERESWIQIPTAGESADELESPAPSLTLTAAGDGHGHSDEAAAEGADHVEAEKAALAAASDDGDGPSTGLAIAALVLGALGLVAGVAGLVQARRARG